MTTLQNNNHHVAEKIANLEKEKHELSEKLKSEALCRSVAEEEMAKLAKEKMMIGYVMRMLLGILQHSVYLHAISNTLALFYK